MNPELNEQFPAHGSKLQRRAGNLRAAVVRFSIVSGKFFSWLRIVEPGRKQIVGTSEKNSE